jgi:hypothetical protein
VTLPTGNGVTVTEAVPFAPSLVAVIVAEPSETAVTTPVSATDATSGLLDVQATARPVTICPFASRSVADRVAVFPPTMLTDGGLTDTLATGTGVTVTLVLPLLPPAVASMVADPGATAFTTPVSETVATRALLELQVTGRSVTTVPSASRTVAVNVVDWPLVTLTLAGSTATLPTGTRITVTVALPVLPSLSAVTVAVPGATAVTTPPSETMATRASLVAQVTPRSVTTAPVTSVSVAASEPLRPAIRLRTSG